ncbi:hypothetical protein [Streptomyces sp. NBC_01589]
MAFPLERAVQRGEPDRASAEGAFARMLFTCSLDDLAGRQLVVPQP